MSSIAALALCGCGSGSSGHANTTTNAQTTTAATARQHATVTIANFAYSPTPITVRLGGSITWKNSDTTEHTATADNGTTFDTGALTHGQSKPVSFTTVGTITYHCAFHPFMHATVIVVR